MGEDGYENGDSDGLRRSVEGCCYLVIVLVVAEKVEEASHGVWREKNGDKGQWTCILMLLVVHD